MPDAKPATVAVPAGGAAPPTAEESTRSGLTSILRTVAMFFLLQTGMSSAIPMSATDG
jgi:hypothetical protein